MKNHAHSALIESWRKSSVVGPGKILGCPLSNVGCHCTLTVLCVELCKCWIANRQFCLIWFRFYWMVLALTYHLSFRRKLCNKHIYRILELYFFFTRVLLSLSHRYCATVTASCMIVRWRDVFNDELTAKILSSSVPARALSSSCTRSKDESSWIQ